MNKEKILDFAYKEFVNYNGLFSLINFDKSRLFPDLVLNRLQIRTWLFINSLDKKKYLGMKDDLSELLKMIKQLCESEKMKMKGQFLNYCNDMEHWRNSIRKMVHYKKRDKQYDGMFLYSIMDFVRVCLFENENKSPIDLVKFAEITDKVLEVVI